MENILTPPFRRTTSVKSYYAQFRQLWSYDHASEWKTHVFLVVD